MAGSLTITGLSAGEPVGERIIGPISIIGKAVIGETLALELAAGENTIKVPLESVLVYILPPVNGESVIKFHTNQNSTDAGLQLNGGPQPFVYTFPEPIPTTLYLHSSTASGVVSIVFI